MIPKIIHQTARTKDISWEENVLVRRMQNKLKGWTYMFHDDDDNDRLVKTYFPEYYNVFSSISKGVAKADIARLIYLYVYGGFYFDTDYKLIKEIPDWMLEKKQLLMESRNSADEYKLGNAVLGSAPNGAFYKDFIECIFKKEELLHLHENRVEWVTGPEALTEFYIKNKDKYKDDVTIIPREYFNPPILKHGLQIKKTKNTIGVHYCWGSWRSGSFLKRIYIFCKRKFQAIL